MATGKTSRPRPTPVMNVTPLVDVALVVLIIFMLIIPMSQKNFWLNFPKVDKNDKPPPAKEEADQGPLVMTIDSRGTIRVNQAVLRRSDIATRLPRMLAAQELPILYFDAADGIPYGQAVELMDLAKASGAKAIAVLTEKVAR
jgi:biopolymer transport protein ExbD